MEELFYFSFADLLVRVEYEEEDNSLHYSAHREIGLNERVIIEQYILSNFALKTRYYQHNPSVFMYLGVDQSLARDLNVFHLRNTLKTVVSRNKTVNDTIKKLIRRSMINYYFEQIGDTILELRSEINRDCRTEEIFKSRDKMLELIKAYNIYSDKKIKLEEIIPEELKSFLL